MMNTKTVIGILLLFFFYNTKTIAQDLDKRACRYVQQQIALVESFHNKVTGYSNELEYASKFLERITNIKSDYIYHYSGLEPLSKEDVVQWKHWYTHNKHLLYWDKTSGSVRVKEITDIASN